MKKLSDGAEVPSRCYYYILEWKDSSENIRRFKEITKQDSLSKINKDDFWHLFKMITEEDHQDHYF